MKQLPRCLAVIICLASSFASAATDETRSDPTRGKHLLDCAAFFGLMSQSKSEFSEGMKVFAFAATSYATVEFANERQVEIEAKKSMALLTDELSTLQENQEALKGKLETCISVLKAAEFELRPRMDELMKALVPEIFGGSQ